MFQERVYQDECQDAVVKHYLEGTRQLLVVMATGTGKTVVFSRLIAKLLPHLPPGKVLVFAHREELIDQSIATIKAINPGLKVGKEMAEHYADNDSDIVVSCVASIGRSGNTRLSRFGSFNLVICDEAHHSIAETYLRVFEQTGVLKPESRALLLGFTATPKRKNREADDELIHLGKVYKKIAYSYTIRKAIKDGWLVPLRGYRLATECSLDGIKSTAGDFQQDELSKVVNVNERNTQIVKSWMDNGEGRQTVAFTVDIDHAKNLAAEFQRAGHKFEAIWGSDPERAEKLRRHKAREITGLCNAQVLTEGYDDWRVSCIILAAPTKSSSKYTQEVGRGTRLQPEVGNLVHAKQLGVKLDKDDCIVLDVVDNHKRCSLVTFPSLMGLNPEMDLGGKDALETAEKIEALQEKYPGVDFSHLTDLSKVKAFVESIDIFAEPYTDEVKSMSKLSWMATADGDYLLDMPETLQMKSSGEYWKYQHEKWTIRENALEEYEVVIDSTTVKDRVIGIYSTLESAFKEADAAVARFRPDRRKVLLRESEWHNNWPTDAAKRTLRKLTKNRPMIYCLCDGVQGGSGLCTICGKQYGITAGQVSKAISKLKAGK